MIRFDIGIIVLLMGALLFLASPIIAAKPDGTPLYYQDPDGKPAYAAEPAKAADGRD